MDRTKETAAEAAAGLLVLSSRWQESDEPIGWVRRAVYNTGGIADAVVVV